MHNVKFNLQTLRKLEHNYSEQSFKLLYDTRTEWWWLQMMQRSTLGIKKNSTHKRNTREEIKRKLEVRDWTERKVHEKLISIGSFFFLYFQKRRFAALVQFATFCRGLWTFYFKVRHMDGEKKWRRRRNKIDLELEIYMFYVHLR